mgnify:CR=1 FL=1
MGSWSNAMKFMEALNKEAKFVYTRVPDVSRVARRIEGVKETLGEAKSLRAMRDVASDTRSTGDESLLSAVEDATEWAQGVPKKASLSTETRSFLHDDIGRRAAWWDENTDRLIVQRSRRKSPNISTTPRLAGVRTAAQERNEMFRGTSLDGLFDK